MNQPTAALNNLYTPYWKINLQRFFLAALLHGGALIIFTFLFPLPDNSIRLPAFMPPVIGIIWGPAGSLGIAMGSFINDLFCWKFLAEHGTLMQTIYGTLASFLTAYLPYKLWHIIFQTSDTMLFRLTIINMLRYFAIMLLSTAISALFITAIHDPMPMTVRINYLASVIINNLDVTLLIGTPLLAILAGHRYPFYQPASRSIAAIPSSFFDIFMQLFCFALFISLLLPDEQFIANTPYRRLLSLLCFIYILRPTAPLNQPIRKSLVNYPLALKLTEWGFAFMLAQAAIILYSSFQSSSGELTSLDVWHNLYFDIFYSLHFTFLSFIGLLWFVNRIITQPLTEITHTTAFFLKTNSQTPEKNLPHCPEVHTHDEIALLSRSINRMIAAIAQYISALRISMAETARTEAELNIAMQLQTSLLPNPQAVNQRYSSIRLTASMYPAQEVGGDFYDFASIDTKHLSLVIADVSGHGIPAAMFMTITRTMLHSSLNKSVPQLAALINNVNDQLCENNDTAMFTTAIAAIYNTEQHILTYINAGHTSPLILHADGSTEFLNKRSGPMLASMNSLEYRELTVQLAVGDLLILYTDGVTEAENKAGEFWGKKGLQYTVSQLKTPVDKENAVAIIRQSIAEFTNNAPLADDITITTMYIKE